MSIFLITGGTGLVGNTITKLLVSNGHHVIILTRSAKYKQAIAGVEYADWNINKQTIDEAAIAKADYIFHLAGASVFEKRWTKKYKKEIEESRTMSSQLLVNALSKTKHHVKAIVCASATGWYGADKFIGKAFTEEDAAANDFLGTVCQKWEASIDGAEQLGIPVVKLRTGMVLSNGGGFLAPIQKGLKWGIAVIPGNGKQIISWIHIEDLCRMFLFAAENELVNGSYNAVAPMPISMNELTLKEATLKNKSKFITIHVPKFILKIVLGKMSVETTKSVTVSNTLIKSKGFQFIYPTIDSALEALAINRN